MSIRAKFSRASSEKAPATFPARIILPIRFNVQ